MALEASRLLSGLCDGTGRLAHLTTHGWSVPFPGFDWLPLLPGSALIALTVGLGTAGLLMAVGLVTRVSAAVATVAWGSLFLLDHRAWLENSSYLALLLCALLAAMPAGRAAGIDAWRVRRRRGPWEGEIPFWPVFLLRGQLLCVYLFSGVSKLTADWLLEAQPMQLYLSGSELREPWAVVLPPGVAAGLHHLLTGEAAARLLSWAAVGFDLSIGPLMLWRRGRRVGFPLLLAFHAVNSFVLFEGLGWFPLLAAGASTIFLDPAWPRRLWGRSLVPTSAPATGRRVSSGTALAVVLWLLVQALVPCRHLVIPGNVQWTREGATLGWRMKAEALAAHGAVFSIHDPDVLTRAADGGPRIDWSHWPGGRVIHRHVGGERIPWPSLPEFVHLLVPGGGERIVWNPRARGVEPPLGAEGARRRVEGWWLEQFGRPPRLVPLPAAEPRAPLPFLAVDDPALLPPGPGGLPRVDRAAWREALGLPEASPLVVYAAFDGLSHADWERLPPVLVLQFYSARTTRLVWNARRDLDPEGYLHVSARPYVLQRYARRVADLWEQRTGRRPAVTARSELSLNGRPYRSQVDPAVDLAAASYTWLRHNPWITEVPSRPR